MTQTLYCGDRPAYLLNAAAHKASVFEFGPEPQARSLLVFGESAGAASAHCLDQTRFYAAGEMKPSWFMLPEI
ncbi:MAG: penicillin acylase family protein [Acidobacteriota bacterium]|nr:penicillin acylase family protein [Acidobacteriota bacterium]